MRVSTPTTTLESAAADALIVALQPGQKLAPPDRLDKALGGRIGRLIADGEVRGVRGEVTTLHVDDGGIRARRLILVGLGKDAGRDEARAAVGAGAAAAVRARARSLAVAVSSLPLDAAEATRCAVDGVVLGTYRFDRFKTSKEEARPPGLRSLAVLGGDRAAARRTVLVADATNRARDLQNTPSNHMGPAELAQRAREIAGGTAAVTARVHDERWLRSQGMGAFLAVSQASSRGARLIELHYRPARPRRRDVVLGLVGKGITFDSGGLSIKPARSMVGMKYDMSGAAAVIEATAAIAELKLPIRVITVAGATENLLDSAGFKVDDIITAGNGKTIEITNTDAEGRLVLADCLYHARRLGATHLVDLATLTGAVRVALGDFHAGMMGTDQEFLDLLLESGEQSGEHLWQLPLHDTFRRFINSRVADMANASSQGLAGAPYAARFLQEFAGDGPWAHLDIAGTADLERSRGDEMAKGGTGFGVRLLVELAERLC
ncbi:MAG: leucyl aminopeptidase [Gaiellales bacterium]